MAEKTYEKEYLKRKERLKKIHKSLSNPKTKNIQELYHKIIGTKSSYDDEENEE